MASAQKVVTVDVGTSTLKVGEFAVGRGGTLTLLRFGVTELGLDPNKEEDRAPAHHVRAGQSLQGRRACAAGMCSFPFPARASSCKFVKLPPVAADQVEQVVAFRGAAERPVPDQRGDVGLPNHADPRRRRGG